jgi:hypothetical protein
MAGPRIAGISIAPERPTSCKRAMIAAATAHPRGPACALGSIETSGSKTFMRTRLPCHPARLRVIRLWLCISYFRVDEQERYGFAVPLPHPLRSAELTPVGHPTHPTNAPLPTRHERSQTTCDAGSMNLRDQRAIREAIARRRGGPSGMPGWVGLCRSGHTRKLAAFRYPDGVLTT